MKYIVMECHDSYAVLLDEEGRFVKAAALRYQVGETVENPVLMRDVSASSGANRNARLLRLFTGTAAALAACLVLVFGLRFYQTHLAAYSSILLSINPEVRMDLNRQGDVIELTGTNEDGVLLLEGYDGSGKSRLTVTQELIDRAIDMGFLSEGGQISFSIDTPDEVLFQEYGLELRDGVTTYLADRLTVTIRITDAAVIPGNSSADAPAPSTEPAAVPSSEADAQTDGQTRPASSQSSGTAQPSSEASPVSTQPATQAPTQPSSQATAPAPTQAPTQAPTPAPAQPSTQAPTAPPSTQAPGSGDSGYDSPAGDSAYEEQPEGDSAYEAEPENSGDSAYGDGSDDDD